jgi:hypothetical protein
MPLFCYIANELSYLRYLNNGYQFGYNLFQFFPFVSFADVAASGGGADSYLLQQDGFFILQQDGSKIITASSSGQVDVQVWHKNTKTMVEAQRDVTISGSKNFSYAEFNTHCRRCPRFGHRFNSGTL